DDAQSCGRQRRRAVDEHARVVGTSMAQRGDHPLGAIGRRRLIIEPQVTRDAAHGDVQVVYARTPVVTAMSNAHGNVTKPSSSSPYSAPRPAGDTTNRGPAVTWSYSTVRSVSKIAR